MIDVQKNLGTKDLSAEVAAQLEKQRAYANASTGPAETPESIAAKAMSGGIAGTVTK